MVYWGRCPSNTYTKSWGVFDRIKDILDFSLKDASKGVKHELWLPAPFEGEEPIICSCVKQDAPDIMCESCYGLGILGGYRKYGYNYLEFGSTMPDLIYNSNELELNTNFRPYRLQLKDGINNASIYTNNRMFNFQVGSEFKINSYLRDTNNLVLVYFDIGSGWQPISNISNIEGAYLVRFKIDLQRNPGERSPFFEFLRVRTRNLSIKEPYIYISRTRNPEDVAREKHGLKISETGISFWTLLDFELPPRCFVKNIEKENPFYGNLYELYNFRRSFFGAYRFRQVFEERVITPTAEIYGKVF